MVALVIAWQLAVVYLAHRLGLWDFHLLKDTVVVVVAGGFLCGFRALALVDGKETWRGEVQSLDRPAP
ncbi:MAG: hypothetical protein M3P83_08985 [Actinomycetota bacterium]|nr:hypothetical protein [Actinomycetota bacterium]